MIQYIYLLVETEMTKHEQRFPHFKGRGIHTHIRNSCKTYPKRKKNKEKANSKLLQVKKIPNLEVNFPGETSTNTTWASATVDGNGLWSNMWRANSASSTCVHTLGRVTLDTPSLPLKEPRVKQETFPGNETKRGTHSQGPRSLLGYSFASHQPALPN